MVRAVLTLFAILVRCVAASALQETTVDTLLMRVLRTSDTDHLNVLVQPGTGQSAASAGRSDSSALDELPASEFGTVDDSENVSDLPVLTSESSSDLFKTEALSDFHRCPLCSHYEPSNSFGHEPYDAGCTVLAFVAPSCDAASMASIFREAEAQLLIARCPQCAAARSGLAIALGHPLFFDSGHFQAPSAAAPNSTRCTLILVLAGVAALVLVKVSFSLRRSRLASQPASVCVVEEEPLILILKN